MFRLTGKPAGWQHMAALRLAMPPDAAVCSGSTAATSKPGMLKDRARLRTIFPSREPRRAGDRWINPALALGARICGAESCTVI